MTLFEWATCLLLALVGSAMVGMVIIAYYENKWDREWWEKHGGNKK